MSESEQKYLEIFRKIERELGFIDGLYPRIKIMGDAQAVRAFIDSMKNISSLCLSGLKDDK